MAGITPKTLGCKEVGPRAGDVRGRGLSKRSGRILGMEKARSRNLALDPLGIETPGRKVHQTTQLGRRGRNEGMGNGDGHHPLARKTEDVPLSVRRRRVTRKRKRKPLGILFVTRKNHYVPHWRLGKHWRRVAGRENKELLEKRRILGAPRLVESWILWTKKRDW